MKVTTFLRQNLPCKTDNIAHQNRNRLSVDTLKYFIFFTRNLKQLLSNLLFLMFLIKHQQLHGAFS